MTRDRTEGTAGPQGSHPDPHEPTILRSIEERHLADLEQRPAALRRSLALWAAFILLGAFAVLQGTKHFKDHHRLLSPRDLLSQAQQPARQTSAFMNFFRPDYAHLAKTELRNIRFLEGDRLIFADGSYVQLAGVDDLPGLVERCAHTGAPALVRARIGDGAAHIERISCGKEDVAQGGEMRLLAQLEPSAATPPARNPSPSPGVYQQLATLPLEQTEVLRAMSGAWISLSGTLESQGERTLLRLADGTGVAVVPTRRGGGVDKLLRAFAGTSTPVQIDLVLSRVFPWEDARDPTRARRSSRLAGEAVAYSGSAQNYHVFDRR